MSIKDQMTESEWYSRLQELAHKHGESVADYDAWIEDYHNDKSPEETFYAEYPEYK